MTTSGLSGKTVSGSRPGPTTQPTRDRPGPSGIAAPDGARRTDPVPDPGATEAIAERYRDLRYEDLPADVVLLAKQCLIDWLGVSLAGCREPVSAILATEMLDQGAHPQATIIGRSPRVSAYQAAMANGTAAHALDYDDVLETMLGHPSAPIYAAVLALGEAERRSGRACLTAFVAGVEIASRPGRLVTPSHYELGFHTTGTIGTLGAAGAARTCSASTLTRGGPRSGSRVPRPPGSRPSLAPCPSPSTRARPRPTDCSPPHWPVGA